MKSRCNDENNKKYWWRWISYDKKRQTFDWFVDDMEQWYSDELQIDRIDNDWNYSKENCRWVTAKDNCNNRRQSKKIEYKWEIHTIAERERIYWLNYDLLWTRLRRWMSFENAIQNKHLKKRMFTRKWKTQWVTDRYKELGINKWTFESRLYRDKKTIAQALWFEPL
jgi:hypothetical protein